MICHLEVMEEAEEATLGVVVLVEEVEEATLEVALATAQPTQEVVGRFTFFILVTEGTIWEQVQHMHCLA